MSSDAGAGIRLEGVTKRYPRRRGSAYSVRALLFERATRDGGTFEALRDVTFAVRPGTTTGLIGGNGAGKSTLLRVAAGLTPPTEGRVMIPPDTQSVLGLGASFDGTLTGRENALTALIVNGMSRREARGRLEDVRAFSELESFFDSPVRTYSAGMGLRLAFGVSAQFRAAAFLVDEVLSVGDLAFEQKCIDHLGGLKRGGATIMMASHDLGRIEELCDEVVWMHGGRVHMLGAAGEVVAAYRDAMRSKTLDLTPVDGVGPDAEGLELRRNRFGSQELRLERVLLNGARDAAIPQGGALRIEARVAAGSRPARAVVGISVRPAASAQEIVSEYVELGTVADDRRLALELERLDLAPGAYLVDIGLYRSDWESAFDYHWGAHALQVDGEVAGARLLAPPARWSIDSAEAEAPSPTP
ncbi:MAG: lipopolysaccharide transport system ATP-binding protein [Miltoncostaeaceae bacterium]|jgi:lipopolysaccharide transport system ATP-binding protein|nr:lipopolysaccharide transport system ATP-binding protein [Miltoncostaeaceae bacterium]